MLILTRKPQQNICIGDDIKIRVLGFRRDQICIGIDAPKDVPVHRQEIYDRIHSEVKDAS